MNKYLRPFVLIACFYLYQVSNAQTLSFSLNPMHQCYSAAGNSATAQVGVAPGTATSFSWTISGSACTGSIIPASNGSIANVSYPCAGVYTVVCSAYNSTNALITSISKVDTVLALPSLTITSSTSSTSPACAGNTVSLCGSGATSYTWVPGNVVGACYTVGPTASTCYTLIGKTGNCSAMAVNCVSVMPSPTIMVVASSSAVCLGGTATLTVSGANTYTWSGGLVGAQVVVSPTITNLYSVVGMNSFGCTSTASVVVIVNPTPTIMAVTSPTSICFGSFVFLNGPSTCTVYPGGQTLPANITPTVSTCYTLVNSTGSSPCTASTQLCINLMPLPTVTITGSNTVCAGSSTTLTASGALVYNWSNGPTLSSVVVMPTVTTCYTVIGTNANGCSNASTVCVNVNTACAMVWPGDANSDGVVNSSDVLEIGLAFNSTGPARSPGGNSYTAQYASVWSGAVSTGPNLCHADCDGSGTIDNGDTVAIYNNFSLTHSFRPSGASGAAGMQIVLPNNIANMGQWNVADIVCSDNLTSVYGMVFDINFDQSLIETNSAYIAYTPSFLNASNQNVQFRKTVFATGKVYAATVRTDATNVSGTGKIGELYFKVKDGLPANTTLNMSISNAYKIDKNAAPATIGGNTTAAAVVENPVGVKEKSRLDYFIQIYPNPASKQLNLYNSAGTHVVYTLYDVLGKVVTKGELSSNKTLDISSCESGCFLMKFENGSSTVYKKIIIEN